MPTHAMMTKAPSTSAGYRSTIASSWPMTSRIMTMPRMPPVRITHIFGDIATATRIESMAKTMSVSSTFTTVAQNGGQAEHRPVAFGGVRRASSPAVLEKWWTVRYSRYAAPASFTHPELDQVDGEQRRERAEDEGAEDAVAERLPLLVLSAGRARERRAPSRCRR